MSFRCRDYFRLSGFRWTSGGRKKSCRCGEYHPFLSGSGSLWTLSAADNPPVSLGDQRSLPGDFRLEKAERAVLRNVIFLFEKQECALPARKGFLAIFLKRITVKKQ